MVLVADTGAPASDRPAVAPAARRGRKFFAGNELMMLKKTWAALFAGVAALTFAAPAQADPDSDFAKELHTYGIYGQKDFNAWIAKIACKRLDRGVDVTAADSAKFVSDQLLRGTSTEQAYQFLGAAMNYYCPDKRVLLTQQ
jgi:hypothetical protein